MRLDKVEMYMGKEQDGGGFYGGQSGESTLLGYSGSGSGGARIYRKCTFRKQRNVWI